MSTVICDEVTFSVRGETVGSLAEEARLVLDGLLGDKEVSSKATITMSVDSCLESGLPRWTAFCKAYIRCPV